MDFVCILVYFVAGLMAKNLVEIVDVEGYKYHLYTVKFFLGRRQVRAKTIPINRNIL